ncbi:MAG: chalcone isomerase family protein [Sandaracinus sp.]
MSRTLSLALALALVLVPVTALALDVNGVHFEDTVQVGDQTLVLNGAGTRHATIFNVNVYVAALYVPTRTSDASAIIRPDVTRQVVLVMKRDVDAETMANAIREGLTNAAGSRASAISSELDAFVAWVPPMRERNRMTVTFSGGRLSVTATGAHGTFHGSAAMGDAFFRMWLGAHPVEDGLRDEMLGRH